MAAYLMSKKNYSATEVSSYIDFSLDLLYFQWQALTYMRQFREIAPNLGFLHQLANLDNDLRKERYRKYNFLERPIKYGI